MDYDTVLQHVGQMGPYQIVMVILLGLCTFYNAFNTLGMNLLGPHHDHVCDVTEGKGDLSYFQLLLVAPLNPETGSVDSCRMLDLDWTNTTVEEVSSWNRSLFETHPTVFCHEWTFNTDQYARTFTSEWSAVCGNSWLRQILTNAYQGGLLVGSFVSGQVADRIGRKKTLVISLFFGVILGVTCAIDPEMISFLVFRFLFAITVRGCELTSFVLITEILSMKWTAFAGIIVMFMYALGGLVVSGIGLGISDFRWLQLSFLPLPLLMLSYYFILPESPKWLVTKGRYAEVEQIFKTMAKFNKKQYPESVVNQYLKQAEAETKSDSSQKNKVSITRIFKADLRKTTLLVIMDWSALMLIYSAFTVSMNELAGSIYINIALACVLEIPGFGVSVFIIRRFGRKWPVVVAFGLTALMSFIAVPLQLFPDLSEAVTILSLVSRAILSSVYGMYYIYSALLFPTEVRQIALGTVIAIGSAFGLAAPYIAGPVASLWTPLPNIIFGACALMASVATVFLKEVRCSGSSANTAPPHVDQIPNGQEETSIPITSSAYRPAAFCVPTDIYPITKPPTDEEAVGDEELAKKKDMALQFKETSAAGGPPENGCCTNEGFVGDGFI